MIGCLIAGGIAVFAISRMLHARRWCHAGGGCGSRYGGWHGWHGEREPRRLILDANTGQPVHW